MHYLDYSTCERYSNMYADCTCSAAMECDGCGIETDWAAYIEGRGNVPLCDACWQDSLTAVH